MMRRIELYACPCTNVKGSVVPMLQPRVDYKARDSAKNHKYFTLGELWEIINSYRETYKSVDYEVKTSGVLHPRVVQIQIFPERAPAEKGLRDRISNSNIDEIES